MKRSLVYLSVAAVVAVFVSTTLVGCGGSGSGADSLLLTFEEGSLRKYEVVTEITNESMRGRESEGVDDRYTFTMELGVENVGRRGRTADLVTRILDPDFGDESILDSIAGTEIRYRIERTGRIVDASDLSETMTQLLTRTGSGIEDIPDEVLIQTISAMEETLQQPFGSGFSYLTEETVRTGERWVQRVTGYNEQGTANWVLSRQTPVYRRLDVDGAGTIRLGIPGVYRLAEGSRTYRGYYEIERETSWPIRGRIVQDTLLTLGNDLTLESSTVTTITRLR